MNFTDDKTVLGNEAENEQNDQYLDGHMLAKMAMGGAAQLRSTPTVNRR